MKNIRQTPIVHPANADTGCNKTSGKRRHPVHCCRTDRTVLETSQMPVPLVSCCCVSAHKEYSGNWKSSRSILASAASRAAA